VRIRREGEGVGLGREEILVIEGVPIHCVDDIMSVGIAN